MPSSCSSKHYLSFKFYTDEKAPIFSHSTDEKAPRVEQHRRLDITTTRRTAPVHHIRDTMDPISKGLIISKEELIRKTLIKAVNDPPLAWLPLCPSLTLSR